MCYTWAEGTELWVVKPDEVPVLDRHIQLRVSKGSCTVSACCIINPSVLVYRKSKISSLQQTAYRITTTLWQTLPASQIPYLHTIYSSRRESVTQSHESYVWNLQKTVQQKYPDSLLLPPRFVSVHMMDSFPSFPWCQRSHFKSSGPSLVDGHT